MMIPQPPFPDLETILSPARFATYLGWAGGARDRAVELYTLNARLSESLSTPLHMLEVALRNRIHDVLRARDGETWFDRPVYHANPRPARHARQGAPGPARGPQGSLGRLDGRRLTFGLWTAMLGKEYEDLWQQALHKIARRADGKGLRRKDFTRPLAPIRLLRNRIAHHEPVLHWDLARHHAVMLELTGWLSPVAAEWCRASSRFPNILPAGGIVLAAPAGDTP